MVVHQVAGGFDQGDLDGGQVVHQVTGGFDQGDFWPVVVGVARCWVQVKVQHVMTTRWKCLVMILSDDW